MLTKLEAITTIVTLFVCGEALFWAIDTIEQVPGASEMVAPWGVLFLALFVLAGLAVFLINTIKESLS